MPHQIHVYLLLNKIGGPATKEQIRALARQKGYERGFFDKVERALNELTKYGIVEWSGNRVSIVEKDWADAIEHQCEFCCLSLKDKEIEAIEG